VWRLGADMVAVGVHIGMLSLETRVVSDVSIAAVGMAAGVIGVGLPKDVVEVGRLVKEVVDAIELVNEVVEAYWLAKDIMTGESDSVLVIAIAVAGVTVVSMELEGGCRDFAVAIVESLVVDVVIAVVECCRVWPFHVILVVALVNDIFGYSSAAADRRDISSAMSGNAPVYLIVPAEICMV